MEMLAAARRESMLAATAAPAISSAPTPVGLPSRATRRPTRAEIEDEIAQLSVSEVLPFITGRKLSTKDTRKALEHWAELRTAERDDALDQLAE